MSTFSAVDVGTLLFTVATTAFVATGLLGVSALRHRHEVASLPWWTASAMLLSMTGPLFMLQHEGLTFFSVFLPNTFSPVSLFLIGVGFRRLQRRSFGRTGWGILATISAISGVFLCFVVTGWPGIEWRMIASAAGIIATAGFIIWSLPPTFAGTLVGRSIVGAAAVLIGSSAMQAAYVLIGSDVEAAGLVQLDSLHVVFVVAEMAAVIALLFSLVLVVPHQLATQKEVLSERNKARRRLLQAVLDNVDAAIFIIDQQHRYRYVNQACADIFGLSHDQIIGMTDIELLGSEAAEHFRKASNRVMEMGQPERRKEEIFDGDGTRRFFWTAKVPFDPGDAEDSMLIGISTEIAPLHEAQEKLRRLALVDPLTGLSNRRDFNEQADRELSRSRRQGTPTALLLMDLDWFKTINDRFGHPAGDDVLIKVAHLINGVTRAEDVAVRLGGEEFALLMPGTDRNEALAVAERLRVGIAAAQHGGAELDTFTVTISIGVAVCASGQTSTKDFYRLADEALMRAKTKGRNRVEAWDQ